MLETGLNPPGLLTRWLGWMWVAGHGKAPWHPTLAPAGAAGAQHLAGSSPMMPHVTSLPLSPRLASQVTVVRGVNSAIDPANSGAGGKADLDEMPARDGRRGLLSLGLSGRRAVSFRAGGGDTASTPPHISGWARRDPGSSAALRAAVSAGPEACSPPACSKPG